jgi:hypothetical protein
MKYLVGWIGGLFMLAAVFLLTGMLVLPYVPHFMRPEVNFLGFGTNNVLGLILGLLAAFSSYRAAVKRR